MPLKVDGLDRLSAAFERMVDKQIPEAVERFHRQVTLLLLTKIVEKTPVDTGRARASWIVSVERPSEDSAPARTYVNPIALAVASADAALTGLKPYSVAFIQNNLPYIARLEGGYSKQAPRGMAGLSVNEVATFLEGGLS